MELLLGLRRVEGRYKRPRPRKYSVFWRRRFSMPSSTEPLIIILLSARAQSEVKSVVKAIISLKCSPSIPSPSSPWNLTRINTRGLSQFIRLYSALQDLISVAYSLLKNSHLQLRRSKGINNSMSCTLRSRRTIWGNYLSY